MSTFFEPRVTFSRCARASHYTKLTLRSTRESYAKFTRLVVVHNFLSSYRRINLGCSGIKPVAYVFAVCVFSVDGNLAQAQYVICLLIFNRRNNEQNLTSTGLKELVN